MAEVAPADPPARGGPQRIPRPAGWAPGPAAPWGHVALPDRRIPLDVVRAAFAGPAAVAVARFQALADDHPRSAVLAPVYERRGEAWVVLTRRTDDLRTHTSEVSFPGGRREPGEALQGTALREAEEEIGLDPATVEIIGELDHSRSAVTGTVIAPYVGVLAAPPEGLRRNPGEVLRILHVPLGELLLDEVYREEHWRPQEPSGFPIHFFELVGETVWGATARMLRELLCRCLGLPWRWEASDLGDGLGPLVAQPPPELQ